MGSKAGGKATTSLAIEVWALAKITPYENNPRNNDAAVDAVAASIQQFGFRKPIVVDKRGVIICGHTTLRAAQQLGLAEAPVHIARDLSPEKVRAYRIADNKTGELADWDWDKLREELLELKADDVDVAQLGFDFDELTQLIDEGLREGNCDPDDVPAPPDQARTRPGDMYLLGDHVLLCGDSANRADLERLLGGKKVQLVFSDPPYNVAVQPRGEIKAGRKLRAKDRAIANDDVDEGKFAELLAAWFGNVAQALEPGRSFYLCGGYANFDEYPRALKSQGLKFSQAIVWVKNAPVMNRKDFLTGHEWIFYGWREGAGHQFFGPNNAHDIWQLSRAREGTCDVGTGLRLEAPDGGRIDVLPPDESRKLRQVKLGDEGLGVTMLGAPSDVWRVKKVPGQKMVHLTEKPVELAVRAMKYSSRPGELVLDLFGGSGSTLIAAEQTGRRARLIELDPLYCDVIVERYEKFSGKKAKRVPAPLHAAARRQAPAASKKAKARA